MAKPSHEVYSTPTYFYEVTRSNNHVNWGKKGPLFGGTSVYAATVEESIDGRVRNYKEVKRLIHKHGKRVVGLFLPPQPYSLTVWEKSNPHAPTTYTSPSEFEPDEIASNKALARLERAVSRQTGGAETLAESESSLIWAARATSQLGGLLKSIRDLRVDKAREHAWALKKQLLARNRVRTSAGLNPVKVPSNRELKKSHKEFRKGARQHATNTGEAIMSGWLAYNFMFQPTVDAIDESFHRWMIPVNSKPFKVSGYSKGEWFFNQNFPYKVGSPGLHHHGWKESRVIYGGFITMRSESVAALDSLGFTKPVSLAVALTPFSWLINYGINIQQLASNCDPRFVGISFERTYKTVTRRWHDKVYPKGDEYIRLHPSGTYDRFEMRRTVNINFHTLEYFYQRQPRKDMSQWLHNFSLGWSAITQIVIGFSRRT